MGGSLDESKKAAIPLSLEVKYQNLKNRVSCGQHDDLLIGCPLAHRLPITKNSHRSRRRHKRGPMAKIENQRIVETTIEARGAERGPTVRNVLVCSLCLVVVAFAILYLVFFRA